MVRQVSDFAATVQIISTIVLVVVTGWYVVLTKGLLSAARSNQAPQVVVEFAMTSHYQLDFIIANTGARPAQELLFTFARDIEDESGRPLRELGAFKHGIKYLAPGRSYAYRVYVKKDALGAAPGTNVIDLTVTWGDGSQSLKDHVVLDLAVVDGMLFSTFADPMTGVVKALEKLRPRDNMAERMGFTTGPSCPACGEPIKHGARKCPHCLEWLPAKAAAEETLEDEQ